MYVINSCDISKRDRDRDRSSSRVNSTILRRVFRNGRNCATNTILIIIGLNELWKSVTYLSRYRRCLVRVLRSVAGRSISPRTRKLRAGTNIFPPPSFYRLDAFVSTCIPGIVSAKYSTRQTLRLQLVFSFSKRFVIRE